MNREAPRGAERPGTYEENRILIDDICGGCCAPGKYCTLKEILVRSPKDVRTMVQIKCIEKFKYERSAAAGKDIGWEEAHAMWIREGLAETFANLYRRGTSVNTLYTSILKSAQTPPTTGGVDVPTPGPHEATTTTDAGQESSQPPGCCAG